MSEAANLAERAEARPDPVKFRYIDGLRGWAILLVLLIHAGYGLLVIHSLDRYALTPPDITLPGWLRAVCDSAGNGVQLFFVVSAASLTMSFLRTGTLDLRSYARRRFLRIAPMFYLGIVAYLILYGFGPRMWAPFGLYVGDVVATIAFVHSWFSNAINSVVPGGWSIGDEASFYLVLPGLLFLLQRSRVAFVGLFIVVLVAVQAYCAFAIAHGSWSGFKVLWFVNQAPVFLLGILAGWGIHAAPMPARWQGAIAAPAVLAVAVLLMPQLAWPQVIVQPHIVFAALAALLCFLLRGDTSVLFTNAAIVSLGRVSFSVYLLHFAVLAPLHAAVAALLSSRGILFLTVYFASLLVVTYAMACVTYRWIEVPFIRIGAGRPGRRDRRALVHNSRMSSP